MQHAKTLTVYRLPGMIQRNDTKAVVAHLGAFLMTFQLHPPASAVYVLTGSFGFFWYYDKRLEYLDIIGFLAFLEYAIKAFTGHDFDFIFYPGWRDFMIFNGFHLKFPMQDNNR